jgi:hypothetical protein
MVTAPVLNSTATLSPATETGVFYRSLLQASVHGTKPETSGRPSCRMVARKNFDKRRPILLIP